MKIIIGCPSFDHVSADFAMSLAALMGTIAQDRALRREFRISLFNPKGTIIDHARNQCVTAAQDMGATHILFLDSDMVFPPDTLNRLASHHVSVVGGDYPSRYPPHQMNGRPLDSQPQLISGGLLGMKTLPMGCLLVKLSVFTDILTWRSAHPDHILGGHAPIFQYRTGNTNADTLSEDSRFCNEARLAGHTVWMDPFVTRTLGHVGVAIHRYNDGLGAPPR